MQKTINGTTLRKMIIAGANLLEQNKGLVDALNVFPVPDGDTGTNMSLTMKSATREVIACNETTCEALCSAFSKGALRGARGNSGVILSQIIKGLSSVLSEQEQISTKIFAKAIQEGSNVAYKAVTKPKEGTILTVIRVMAEAANTIAKKETDFDVFFKQLLIKGEEILQMTPELLDVLKKAGVVDAGGRGLIILFTGFYQAIVNDENVVFTFDEPLPNQTVDGIVADIYNTDIQFGYCTELMVVNMYKKTTMADIDKMRDKLLTIGDCVICIGDLNLVKVHCHSNEPNKIIAFALALGEITNVKIENMLEQNREMKNKAKKQIPQKPLGMVAVAPGDGIANVFKELMVDELITGGQTMNPSAEDIVSAVEKTPSQNVIIFPNNKNIILAAEQAKALTSKNIYVVPTKSVPEGIAAALCFNIDESADENYALMQDAIKNVQSGSITYAVRATHVDGFDLAVGDIIGLDEKSILAKGSNVSKTLEDLVAKMVTESTVSITLFYGEDITTEQASENKELLAKKYPAFDINVLSGGQPVYYYLVSVE
ncbi:MAG: DAK2 domain-containing protein [Clostridia bacterium]